MAIEQNANDQALYAAAAEFIRERFPPGAAWVGAAAARTASGRILVSTGSLDFPNEAARLCHETGAICEAGKLDDPIAAIICLSRNDAGELDVLPPCGICQERLFIWGGDLLAAVPKLPDRTAYEMRPLSALSPYYWFAPYAQASS